uniref:Coat protein n=1 Tax=Pernambuco virus TaxID=2565395 RepID=A0A4P8JBD9_9VIRU|nr:coat protein [Pernambuco virus]
MSLSGSLKKQCEGQRSGATQCSELISIDSWLNLSCRRSQLPSGQSSGIQFRVKLTTRDCRVLGASEVTQKQRWEPAPVRWLRPVARDCVPTVAAWSTWTISNPLYDRSSCESFYFLVAISFLANMEVSSQPLQFDSSSTNPSISSVLDRDSTRDLCSFEEMLAMETTAARGTVTTKDAAGTVLYATNVCPTLLESEQPTRISYLSKLFLQWHGDMELGFYITKTAFQAAKILVVYAPGYTADQLRAVPIGRLLGFQNRLVVGADSNVTAKFNIPFVAQVDWLLTTQSSGALIVTLMEPVVSSDQTQTSMPWTLTLRSPKGRDQLKFRYSVPPTSSLPPPSGGGGGSGGGDNTADEQTRLMADVGRLYAKSSSTQRTRRSFGRSIYIDSANYAAPMKAGTLRELGTVVPVRLAGANISVLARKLCQFEISAPFTFVGDAVVGRKSILPFLPDIYCWGPQANSGTWGQDFDTWWSNSNNSVEGDGKLVYFGHSNQDFDFYVGVPEEVANEFDGWHVVGTWLSAGNEVKHSTWSVSKATSTRIKLNHEVDFGDVTAYGDSVVVGTPIIFMDSPYNYGDVNNLSKAFPRMLEWLEGQLRRAQSMNMAEYITIYTQPCDPSCARALQTYLNDTSSSVEPGRTYPPKLCTGLRLSFSSSESPLVFDKLYNLEQRGIFSWIFSLFSSDHESAWGRIARVADLVVEFLVPLLVTYDGNANPVRMNGWRVEFERVDQGHTRVSDEGRQLIANEPELRRLYRESAEEAVAELPATTASSHTGRLRQAIRRLREAKKSKSRSVSRRRRSHSSRATAH